MSNNEQSKQPGIWKMTLSVLASFAGVQSSETLDTDNEHIENVGFMPYIIIGIVLTIAFVLIVYGIVQWILAGN